MRRKTNWKYKKVHQHSCLDQNICSNPSPMVKFNMSNTVSAFFYSVHPGVKITTLNAETRRDHAKHRREEVWACRNDVMTEGSLSHLHWPISSLKCCIAVLVFPSLHYCCELNMPDNFSTIGPTKAGWQWTRSVCNTLLSSFLYTKLLEAKRKNTVKKKPFIKTYHRFLH